MFAKRIIWLCAAGLLVACVDDGPTHPGPPSNGLAAKRLSIQGLPPATLDGQRIPLPLVVAALDSLGNPASAAVNVTVAVIRGSASLSGTLLRPTANGLATFDNLTLTGNGPVTLRVAAAGLSPDTSSEIEVMSADVPLRSWSLVRPRVLRAGQSDSINVTLALSAPATRVELVPSGGATTAIPLIALSPTVYSARVPASIAFSAAAYSAGDQHAFLGFLDVYNGAARSIRYNQFVNVRTAAMPDVAVSALSPTAQVSDHVLNLRRDTLLNGNGPSATLAREVYRWLPDNFDFLAVIEQVETFANRFYVGVRNNTMGIGSALFDNGAAWGSASRLQGAVAFPISTFFDGASVGLSHELGHRWMVHIPAVRTGAHWRVSDLAHGIMGVSIPGSGAGGTFDYTFSERGAAGVRFECAPQARDFNRAELYLMGLLPRDSVMGTFIMIDNPPASFECGMFYNGAVRRITVDSLIAAAGGQRPLETNRVFRLGVVVLSAGGLLTPNEMAFFDAMVARAEAATEVPGSEGFSRYNMRSFQLATGGRARLDTRVR